MTYTIIGVDPGKRYLGIASASGSIAVGSRVLWAKYPYAAVATQAYTNPALGPLIISLVEKGYSAREALEKALKTDNEHHLRQVAVLTLGGGKAVYNGENIPREHGYFIGNYSVCIANLVVNPELAETICSVFEEYLLDTDSLKDFAFSLLEGLKTGHSMGGDKRGDRSAAILIVGRTPYDSLYDRLIDLRVDYSTEPVEMLRDITEKYLG